LKNGAVRKVIGRAVPVSPYIPRVYENIRVAVAKTPIFQYNWGMVPILSATTPSAPNAAKSMLARLLATENISVVHQNIPTAFFDLRTRSLHLPMWSNASGSLYDMLVGHEVAHALFTPADGWRTGIDSIAAATGCDQNTAKQYLNIVEDARIERMIQTKFRGLKSDFINAYKTLMEREFFGDISNPNSMIFADRFNLHFKCGVHAGTVIRFSTEEAAFVTRGETVATWAEVVALAQDMIVYAQEQKAKQQQQSNEPQSVETPEDGEDGDAEVDASGTDDSQEQSDEGGSNGGSGEGDERESESQGAAAGDEPSEDEPQGESEANGKAEKKKPSNEMTSGIAPQTNQNLEKALEEFAKSDMGEVEEIVRVTTKELSQSCKVLDYTQFLGDMRSSGMSRYMAQPIRITDYTTASTTMATAFNRRKAADNWRRTSVSKSGSLDTLRMNQYKWTDDIFRRTTRVADGKNHGIVILLDWSSSMSNIMQSTMGQLFILADFCRKCGIPFEVYAFSDMGYFATKDGYSAQGKAERDAAYTQDVERRQNALLTTKGLTMMNLLSSRMNGADYEAAKTCLWNWRQMGSCDYRYGLNGTPTTAALVAAADLVEAFIKRSRIQIAHTVVLTDGEPTDAIDFNWHKFNPSAGYRRESKTAVVLTDERTGAAYDLNRVTKYGKDAYGYRSHMGYFNFGTNGIPDTVRHPQCMIAVDILRRRTGSKVHWIGLVGYSRRGIEPSHYGMVCKTNEWKRDGFLRGDVWGWDSAIIVDADRFSRDANGEISRNAQDAITKAESKMDTAKTNNSLAKAFMETQIAHGALRTVASHIGEYLAV